MLHGFYLRLREVGIPATITEYLTLLDAMQQRVVGTNIDDFYLLARLCLVKDERFYDRFDAVFSAYYEGIQEAAQAMLKELPSDWLRRLQELHLSEAERAQVKALGGWEKLLDTLRQRLTEQHSRHQGGSKWIGTAGTSPFGAYGYNPEGVRIGQAQSRHRRAVKIWDQREFKNLDADRQLGVRNMKLALRRLRRFARQGAQQELDLPNTIRSTAHNAGLLDVQLIPERRNAVRVLLLFDIGGSMDWHVESCAQLFTAARAEFAGMAQYYFHNFLYESVWCDNRRRWQQRIPTLELLRTYGRDYKLILVGDATMSPYEILQPGGSIEHWNQEAGRVWLQRLTDHYPKVAWLNPEPEQRWSQVPSIQIIQRLVEQRMFPLTLQGLDRAMRSLH